MPKEVVSVKTCLALLLATALSLGTFSAGQCADATPIPLIQAQRQTEVELGKIDAALSKAARQLGRSGLAGEDARAALRELCGRFAYAIDCAAVSEQGIMVTIEPASFSGFEGGDISQQQQFKQMRETRRPVLSRVFRTLEGIDAADAEYPVITPDGCFLGSASILIRPEKLLDQQIAPITQGLPVHIWTMETGGRILYDQDPSQVGLNLFESDLYKPYTQLINLGQAIASASAGTGIYEFISPITREPVQNRAAWQSARLFGNDWRLVATYALPKNIHSKYASTSPEKMRLSLGGFVKNPALIEALRTDNAQMALSMFKEFYDSTPGIYSVQWVNAAGINRFGFPLENSLSNYDFRAGRNESDSSFAARVGRQAPAEYSTQLFEGASGLFLLQPVFDNAAFLGMVYIITLQ